MAVACEPTGPRWLQVQRLCAERGLPLVAELHCYVPEELDETWAHLRHLGAAPRPADHRGDRVGAADPGFPLGGLADGDRGVCRAR